MSGYDLKDEAEVKQFLENLGIEYRFSCYHENKPDGCHLLGDYLESVKKDFAKALTVYELNCDKNNFAKSCYKFGSYNHLGRGCIRDDLKAFRYFEKGCQLNNSESCLLAGVMAATNEAVKSKAKPDCPLTYLRKSCLANNAEACNVASGIYIQGTDGVEKDMKMAFEYATKGCELGHLSCCTNLSRMYRKGEGTEKNEALANKFKEMALEIHRLHTRDFQQIKFGE